MPNQSWYLITYDIRHPRRLARAAKLIGRYGDRLQYSVYRVQATNLQISELRWKLAKELENEDDLLIIPICNRCAARIHARGKEQSWENQPENFEIP